MKKLSIIILLVISLALAGCAGMSDTEQRTLSGGAIGAGAGAVVGAIAGHTAAGAIAGEPAGLWAPTKEHRKKGNRRNQR